jgi:hypothetical protein
MGKKLRNQGAIRGHDSVASVDYYLDHATRENAHPRERVGGEGNRLSRARPTKAEIERVVAFVRSRAADEEAP